MSLRNADTPPLRCHTTSATPPTLDTICKQIDAVGVTAMNLIEKLQGERDELRRQVAYLSRFHPSYGTPNWCSKCTPKGLGYCRCDIASNE